MNFLPLVARGFSQAVLLAALTLLPLTIPPAAAAANARADFNGDGRTDLAIGVPGEDVGSIIDAGAVRIVYGSGSGAPAAGTEQIWHLDSVGIPGTAQSGDHFGAAIASGDFNRDGYTDLAVGMPNKNGNRGQMLVMYGSGAGLSAAGSQIWDQGVLADDPETDDRFASALVAGDFNRDGYDDLAVGVPGEDYPGIGPPEANPPTPNCDPCVNAGVVNVVYGGPSGLTATRNELWHQDRGVSYDGWVEPQDCFGASLASADFNGDGIDDLAVGVPCENTGGADVPFPNNGAVSVYYGSTGGLTGVGAQYLRQWAEDVVDYPQANDAFGYALAAGDFDGDGRADLAIGVPGEDSGGISDAGGVAVFYGAAGGLIRNELWGTHSPDVIGDPVANAHWGYALAAGDFNHDGRADLAIGAPGDSVSAIIEAGSVSILYGAPTGLSGQSSQLFTQDTPGVDEVAEQVDWFGHTLAATDLDGDGAQDLVIGVPFEDYGFTVDAGAVHLLYGSAGTGISATGSRLLGQDGPGSQDISEAGDQFGGRLVPRLNGAAPWPDEPTNYMMTAPTAVNLTAEGSADWVHWGRASVTAPDRKSGVAPQIGNLFPLGGASPAITNQTSSAYAWSDGAPLATHSGTKSGVRVFSAGNGFQFSVPADTGFRTLKVYVGANAARGQFTASLSDGSAPAYTTAVDRRSGRTSQVITLNYRAASPGQTLTVSYVLNTLYQANLQSWITLESAALRVAGDDRPPMLEPIGNRTLQEGELLSLAVVAVDSDGPAPLSLSQTNTLPGSPNILTDNGNGSGTLNWTPAAGSAAGSPYSVTVTATDGAGTSSSTSFTVTVLPVSSHTPYGGSAWPIPGIIEAENYDLGGSGVGYFDTTAGNAGNLYRSDGVDIWVASDVDGAYMVGQTSAGEWLDYTVNVAAAGSYTLNLRVATAVNNKRLRILMNGADITGSIAVPNTGGWTAWTTLSRTVTLNAGQQTLRLQVDSGSFNVNWIGFTSGFSNAAPTLSPIGNQTVNEGQLLVVPVSATDADGPAPLSLSQTSTLPGSPNILTDNGNGSGTLNWTPAAGSAAGSPYSVTVTATDGAGTSSSTSFTVTVLPVSSHTPYGGSAWPIPGIIEAENYDLGGSGVGYFDTTAGNAGNLYRSDGVDIWVASDVDGAYMVGQTSAGEWLDYTVNVAAAGSYTLNLRVATAVNNKRLRILMNGADITGSIAVPNTGGWTAWTTLSRTVTLNAGQQTLRLQVDSGSFNVNWIGFSGIN
ncbi:MAG: FG-GAP repeat protein [Gammaproteobacteria bacterium]|nr:FG-GAP repeat protein [Gammaproteobacteria bacterium]